MDDILLSLFDILRLTAFVFLCNFMYGLYKCGSSKKIRAICIVSTIICFIAIIIANHYTKVVWR